MRRNPLIRILALLGAFALAAAAPPPPDAHPAAQTNWIALASRSAGGGIVLGNPAAKLKLVEYMSYTCPHCAEFEVAGMPQLRLTAVAQGKLSVEIRHLLRDGIDATIAQLTNCVAPSRFMPLHDDFLHRQEQWIATAQHATQAQTARWFAGARPAQMRAIAGDLGFYTIMERHGLSRSEVDRCFADEAIAKRIVGETKAAQDIGAAGTPAFVLDGILLAGTYDWAALRPQIEARL